MKIEVLFPEFCNLFGDAYNMVYLEKTLPEAEFIRTKFSDDVRFTEEKAPAGLREQLAEELAQKGGAALYAELQQVDPEAAAVIHPNNQVRVLRALEHYRATGKKLSEQKAASLPPERPYRSLILGLDFPDRAALYRRIDLRVDKMLEAGILDGDFL